MALVWSRTVWGDRNSDAAISSLDRPSTIADEIRQQLEAQRAADAETAEKRGQADRLAAVEDRLKGMTEQAPQPPERRIEKFLGWR